VIVDGKRALVEKLSRSQIYCDYEKAFTQTTGLSLAIRPVEVSQLAHQGKTDQSPFCALMGQSSESCAACLQAQREMSQQEGNGLRRTVCFAGLSEAAVPVRAGNETVGFLQTGGVHLRRPTAADFHRLSKILIGWGFDVHLSRVEDAFFRTLVLTAERFDAVLRLLSIFAEHLGAVSNQVLVQQTHAEPPNIVRAKQFIQEHQANDLTLTDVARAVNTSTFYFCKMFKKATGLKFTDYLSRVRVEKAKNLLINPNLRVSEIAYEVGFQSLTHFNRVFRRMVGQSPTEYRAHLVLVLAEESNRPDSRAR